MRTNSGDLNHEVDLEALRVTGIIERKVDHDQSAQKYLRKRQANPAVTRDHEADQAIKDLTRAKANHEVDHAQPALRNRIKARANLEVDQDHVVSITIAKNHEVDRAQLVPKDLTKRRQNQGAHHDHEVWKDFLRNREADHVPTAREDLTKEKENLEVDQGHQLSKYVAKSHGAGPIQLVPKKENYEVFRIHEAQKGIIRTIENHEEAHPQLVPKNHERTSVNQEVDHEVLVENIRKNLHRDTVHVLNREEADKKPLTILQPAKSRHLSE